MIYSDFPASKKSLLNFVSQAETFLKKGQSVNYLGLPLSGKSGFLRYFLREGQNLGQKVTDFKKEFLFVYFDLGNIPSPEGIFKVVEEQLNEGKEKNNWQDLLTNLTFQKSKKIVLIIDEAELFFSLPTEFAKNFWQIAQVNPMATRFWFLLGSELDQQMAGKKLGKLSLSFFQNLIYLKLLEKEDVLVGIDNQEKWHQLKLTLADKEALVKISGCWGSFMRLLLRKLSSENEKKVKFWLKNPDDPKTLLEVLKDTEVLYHFDRLYQAFSEKTQNFLKDFYLKKKTSEELPVYLEKTGCFSLEKGNLKAFCPWFETYLKNKIKTRYPSILEKDGYLFFNERALDELLTPQELSIFKLLWLKRNQIVTRDQIAQSLWGQDSYDKYSDWAIDKVMMRIRKKIGDTRTKRVIQAVKGKGIKLKVNT